jgi:hypothetical protein
MRKATAASAQIALLVLGGVSLAAGATVAPRDLELPRGFVENRGQWPEEAAWAARSFYGSSWVLRDGRLRHVFLDRSGCEGGRDREPTRGCRASAWVVEERLLGSLTPVLAAEGPKVPLEVSYFVGRDESRHVRDLPAYERLSLGEVYPGIRLKLLAHSRSIEKLFELAPGADAGRIEIGLRGVEGLRMAEDGALLLATGYGEVRLSPPVAWQEGASGREPVTVAYRVIGDAAYGFALGDHDPSRPLFIDPLIQATYAGGGSNDEFWALDFDPVSGDVFVGGETASSDFPQVAGGADPTIGGFTEGVILRIRPSLDNQPWGGFVQATFFGGSNSDVVRALRIAGGYVYAAGYTFSNDLPSATGALGGFQGGAADGFVLRLDLSLTSGLIASYYGGSGDDRAYAIEVGGGAVFIAGVSSSSNLPSTAGAAFNSLNGSGPDGFIARFSSDLSSIQRTTYYGGSSFDEVRAIAHVPGTPAYIGAVGATNSNNLPTTAGAHKPTHPGVGDSGEGFAALFFDDLTAQQAGTYLGGLSNTLADRANAIAYDPVNNRFVIGGEASNGFNDTTPGVVQPSFAGGAWPDAFVVQMPVALNTVLAGTFLGGTFVDVVRAVAIYPGTGHVVAFGSTDSTNFLQHANVTTGSVTPGFAGSLTGGSGEDAFVVRLDGALTSAIFTHHGGTSNDDAVAGGVHPLTGELYWAGRSASADLQGRTNGAQASSAGSTDGYVARASNDLSGGAANPDIQAFYFINEPAVVAPGGGPYTGIGFACRHSGNAAVFLADCQVTPSAGTITYGSCTSPAAPLPAFTPGTPYPAVGPDASGPILQAPAFQLACGFSLTAPGTAGGNDEATQQITLTLTASAVNDAVAGNNTLLSSTIPVLDAIDESASFPANATGQTFLVASNDQLGTLTFGSNPLPPGVSYSLQPGSTCANVSISAAGLATFDVPPLGSCTVNYQVCRGTVCDFATLTVVATGSADMAITSASALPDVGPGQTVTGLSVTCTNVGRLPATNATCSVSVTAGLVQNLVCSPAPPTNVNAGEQIQCTFDYQAPGVQGGADEPAQQVTVNYSTGAANDIDATNNFSSSTASVLDALDEATSVSWTATAQSFNLAANDQFGLGGVPGTASYTLTASSCPNASVSAAGTATFDAPSVPPGTCTLDYRVCIGAGPIPCDVARLTVTSTFPDMQANPPVPPPAAAPGGSEPVSFSCTNAGTDAALQATCSAQVLDCATSAPVGTLSAVSCSPTVPVASLPAGNGISCTASYQAPGSVGGAAIGAGPNLCLVVTAGSNPADPLPANNVQHGSFVLVDAVSESINVGSAGSFNVAANDFNGGPVPPGASYSLVAGPGTTCPSAAITPAGVASYGLPVGTCTITYRVCLSDRCDEAVLSITGLPPPRPIPALGVLGVAGLALGLGLLARRRLRA